MRSERPVTFLVGFFLGLAGLAGSLFVGQTELRAQQPAPRKAPVRKPPAKAAEASTAATAKPQVKGIWEPVNYTEDLQLTDIFCVSVDVCYVSGAAGTILKTTDGGQSWTAQLGGDPQSEQYPIGGLRFIDETHGWAAQGNDLLRTTDGETWQKVGSFYYEWTDYAFTSESDGVYLRKSEIYQTQDGGRTWKEVFSCKLKVEAQGLMRDVACGPKNVHFPTPTIGYAVSWQLTGEKNNFALMKTEDGGATWSVSVIQDMRVDYQNEVFFTDENTGIIYPSAGLHKTTDGGQTWTGLAGSAGYEIKFADPEVGWSFYNNVLAYTTDGGNRWFSRTFSFPAAVHGFSLPRRDRAYVVGDHGMVYRYRVVPADEEVVKGIPAPAMPPFESTLDEEVEELAEEAAALEESFSEAPAATAEEGAEAPPEGAPQEPAEEPAEEAAEAAGEGPAPFVDSCCAKPLSQFESTLNQVSTLLPAFVGKYKNLNLLLAGLRMTSEMPAQVGSLKAAVANLRKARDPMTARMALTELIGQATALSESTLQAFQKPGPQVPPEE